MSMDAVLRAAGITTHGLGHFKTMCCGAAFSLTETEIVYKLSAPTYSTRPRRWGPTRSRSPVRCATRTWIPGQSRDRGAKLDRKRYNLPVFYFTQLIGLAMGIAGRRAGDRPKHLVEAGELIAGERAEEPVA